MTDLFEVKPTESIKSIRNKFPVKMLGNLADGSLYALRSMQISGAPEVDSIERPNPKDNVGSGIGIEDWTDEGVYEKDRGYRR